MVFRPLNDTERRQLINTLRGNAENNRANLMDRRKNVSIYYSQKNLSSSANHVPIIGCALFSQNRDKRLARSLLHYLP